MSNADFSYSHPFEADLTEKDVLSILSIKSLLKRYQKNIASNGSQLTKIINFSPKRNVT